MIGAMSEIIPIILVVLSLFAMGGFLFYAFKKNDFEKTVMQVLKHARTSHNIPCQSVDNEFADRAVMFVKITGMLIFFRMETKIMFLSKRGYTKELIKVILYNVFLGWWGIKSFFLNIGAIGNNLLTLFTYAKLEDMMEKAKAAKFDNEAEAKARSADKRTGAEGTEPSQEVKPASGLAIAGLVTAFIFGPIGLIISIVAFNKINKEPEIHGGRGLAIAGMILGGIFTIYFLLPLILSLVL